MRFALDESGSFTLGAGAPAVSVAVTIVIPPDELSSVLSAYRTFRGTLRPSELVENEPKGRKLAWRSKKRFCELLERHPRIQVCPCILDLDQFPGDTATRLLDGLVEDLRTIAARSDDRVDMERVTYLVSQLNPVQCVRLYTWGYSLAWALQNAILTPDLGMALDEWDQREFVIDPVQSNVLSDEESVFAELLPMWMVNWSIVRPFMLLDDTVHPYNSFRHHFALDDKVDLHAVLTSRVRFDRPSKIDEALQVADIAANIVYRAARNLESDDVAMYEQLMHSCPYEPDFGIGLVTPFQSVKTNRFRALVASMERAYWSQRRVFVG